MTTGITASFDYSEWIQYGTTMDTLLLRLPQVNAAYLLEAGEALIGGINSVLSAKQIDATGTYRNSLQIRVSGNTGEITLVPVGPEAERLPIYWRVLEGGAGPNPRLNGIEIIGRLADWADRKGIHEDDFTKILNKIRFKGIDANPVIGEFFILDGNLQPIGLTSLGNKLVSGALQIFGSWIKETTMRTGPRAGQTQLQLRIPGQRARFLPNATKGLFG